MKTVSVVFDNKTYDEFLSYVKANETTLSQAIRLAVKKYYKLGSTPTKSDPTPTKPAKPDHDPEVRGADGYTRAEREAMYARMEQSKDKPWEPPPPVPMRTNIVSPQVKRDVIAEWDDV